MDPLRPSPADWPPSAEFPFPRPRQKFQSRLWVHGLLFLLTLATTWVMGTLHYLAFDIGFSGPGPDLDPYQWSYLLGGAWYSGTVLAILGAHEFGHYFACRYYNVDATLPYFLPAPFLTGTLGAVIRIREPIPSKRALFDIGVAGPIAGFLVLVPALFIGMSLSTLEQVPSGGATIWMGEPLLMKAAIQAVWGARPEGFDINLHPMAFAAWFGMLATALNLFPFGQLDGGHVTYAVLGRRSSIVSLATIGIAIGLCFLSSSWIVWTILMVVMAKVFGLRHPPTPDEAIPLDGSRLAVAALSVVLFALCFTPIVFQELQIGR